jgi:hypothetical protein
MDNHIINSFIYNKTNLLNDIFLYLKRYYSILDINSVCKEIKYLIKNSLLIEKNRLYNLTEEGNVVKNDNIYYHSKIIFNFMKRYSNIYKKYQLKEIRHEQQFLRKYLIKNRNQICIICNKYLPLELLETAHLKPRYLLNKNELYDKNVVEFMCRYCHKLYDSGFIGIKNSELKVSKLLIKKNYDLTYNTHIIKQFNNLNNNYFEFHYTYIFKSQFYASAAETEKNN